jgi:ABC-type bacteriocin/lantibiotic exporter with double-glycine peptidase domain
MRSLLVVALVLLTGCAASNSVGVSPARFERESGWTVVRHMTAMRQEAQKDCGPVAAAMILAHWDRQVPPADIRRASGAGSGQGVPAAFLRATFRRHGLQSYLVIGTVTDLERELVLGRPVLVGIGKVMRPGRAYPHYDVVVGIRHGHDRRVAGIAVLDPAAGWRLYQRAAFEAEWRLADNLMIVAAPATAATAP